MRRGTTGVQGAGCLEGRGLKRGLKPRKGRQGQRSPDSPAPHEKYQSLTILNPLHQMPRKRKLVSTILGKCITNKVTLRVPTLDFIPKHHLSLESECFQHSLVLKFQD